ncbi:MAG: Omega-amino acid--pyruvate aminotransferase [Cyanobacteria bacterium RYN_339]|nr:Omega-amino acid--pyruvate aminotransferase [Cyanobacteria bacterium RYN_339]
MIETEDISAFTAKHTYATWRKQGGWKPLTVVDAEGCYFTDASGKKYLDLSSQLMCSNLGHKNQAVIDAIAKQAQELAFVAPGFATRARAELTELLLEVVPKGLDKFFFATSGTEANECAIKIARAYTGKYKIISRYSSYHGSTAAAVACTGDWRRWMVEPTGKIDGVVFGPDANCYRCPFGSHMKAPDCGIACVEYFEYMLEREGNVAAIIVEPIVGTNGVLVPPDGYMQRLREITKKHGVLMICDEVMSGWGRTGTWFAVDHWGVVPDILTTAKGISSAYVPLGLTATSAEISKFFDDNWFAHGHTYEAHPLTLAPAVAAINEYKRLNLLERSTQLGEYLKGKLEGLKAKHPSIGDVRGKGLFWAIDLVQDQQTKKPFNTQADKVAGRPMLIDKVTADLMARGVYCVGWMTHLVLAPPLIITEAELDQAVEALDQALLIADAALAATAS